MIDCIFFDVADTLLEKPELMPRIQNVLREGGIACEEATIRRSHKTARELIHFPDHTNHEFYLNFNVRFLEALGVYPDVSIAEELYQQCRGLDWRPFADVEALKSVPVPIGIISNWDHSLSEKLKGLLAFDFQWIIGSADFGAAKPDPALFRHAIERSGHDATSILFVGDSIRLDVVPAREAGMQSILIDRHGLFPYFGEHRITSLHQMDRFWSDAK